MRKKKQSSESNNNKLEKGLNLEREELEQHLALINNFDWNCLAYSAKGMFGLKSSEGKVLLPAKFDSFKPFRDEDIEKGSKVVAMKAGKYGIVCADGKGEWVVPPIYDDIGRPGTITAVRRGDRYGVVDTDTGKLILPVELDLVFGARADIFTNGIAYFEKDGKKGVINEIGEFTEAVFDEAEPNDRGEIVVKFNNEKGFIDKNGRFTQDNNEAWFREVHL